MVYLAFSNICCHCSVGQQHKFLNQLIGFFAFFYNNTDRYSLFIQFKADFLGGEVDGAFGKAFCTQVLCHTVHGQHFFCIFTLTCFYNLLCLFVGKSVIGVNHGTANPVLFHFSLFVDLEDRRKGKFIFVRAQGAEYIGNMFRQHRQYAIRQINRCCPFISFLIQCSIGAHIMAYIGDVYPQFE
ncbi:hypothetical protein D3C87_1401770 [compost metagenome]